MASQDWLEKDFYQVLGVSKDATDAEIKKTYRKLARQYHPDSNPGDKAAEDRFKGISEAYSVLSDAQQRAEYDQIRALGAGGPRFAAPGSSHGSADFEDLLGGLFGGGGRRTSGVGGFENLFGGGFDGYSRRPGGGFPRQQKGADVTARLNISFRQAVRGDTVKLQTSEGVDLTVKIPVGIETGKKIRLPGKGRPGINGGAAGDMIVMITVAKHPVFNREGANLRVEVPISIFEATLGATVEVPVLEGDPVKLKVPAASSSGKVLRVKGKGLVLPKQTGDLLVSLKIIPPDNLDDTSRKTLAELQNKLDAEHSLRSELLGKARE